MEISLAASPDTHPPPPHRIAPFFRHNGDIDLCDRLEQDAVEKQVEVENPAVIRLKGAEIDYEDSLMGGGFRIFNPNAVRSCGCGHSFDTGEDAGNARACGCH